MEAKVSETLFIMQWAPVSTLHQYLVITHFLAFISLVDPLNINQIHVVIQTQNNEVYNVLYNNHVGKLYHMLSINHVGKNTSGFNYYAQLDLTS